MKNYPKFVLFNYCLSKSKKITREIKDEKKKKVY